MRALMSILVPLFAPVATCWAQGQSSVPIETTTELVTNSLLQRVSITAERGVVLCGIDSVLGRNWRTSAGHRVDEYAPTEVGTWCATGRPDEQPRVYLSFTRMLQRDSSTIALQFRRHGSSSSRDEEYVFRRTSDSHWFLLSVTFSGFLES